MKCDACGASAPSDSLFCSACGTPMAPSVRSLSEREQREEVDLAGANLMRVRKRWLEAEARCIDVLRANPNNVHAHSLLGDVYRDQGRSEDARQWYRMALDLSPDSTADQVKLGSLPSQTPPNDNTPSNTATSAQPGAASVLGASPITWIRGITVVSVAFLAITVVAVLAARSRHVTTPKPPPTKTNTATGVPGGAGAVPPRALGPPTASRTTVPRASMAFPGPPQRGPSGPADPAPVEGNAASAAAEARLEAELVSLSDLSSGSRVVAVSLTDAGRVATLVLLRQRRGQGETEPDIRASAARDALRCAQTAFAREPALATVHANVRVDAGEEPAALLMKGVTSRLPAMSVGPGASNEQVVSAFADLWWAQIQSPPGPSGMVLPGLPTAADR